MLVRFASNSGDPQVKLCSDMGLKEAGEFALELKKAERAKEVTADNQQRHQHHHDIIVIIAKIATIIITIVIIAKIAINITMTSLSSSPK